MTTSDRFPTDTAGLSEAVASQSFELADGDRSCSASRRW